MVFEVIDEVFLAMFAKEVELDLARARRPLEVVEGLGGLDGDPALAGVHHALHHVLVVPQQQDVLVQFRLILLGQGQQVVLGLDLPLGLELLPDFLLFSAWPPNGSWLVIGVLVGTAHPLQTPQLLVSVDLVIVLVLLILLLLLFGLGFLGGRVVPPAFRRLLPFFLFALQGTLGAELLGGSMTADVGDSLQLLLLGQLFSLGFLLLLFEALGGGLELLLVDDEEVAGAAL